MQSKFKTEKGNKALEEIGEVLADYSKLLDYAAQFLSEIEPYGSIVRPMIIMRLIEKKLIR